MKTTIDQFHVMRGHVADGCIVVAPSGREFVIQATMRGWQVIGPDGLPCSGNLPGAADVEHFVVNGLQSH